MEPSAKQREALTRHAGARRWVWNWALSQKLRHYKENRAGLSSHVLSAELPLLKKQPATAWLKDIDAQSLQAALRDLDVAFVNFFEKRARFPQFKSRKRDRLRFRIPQRVNVADGRVYVPKVGHVRIRQSRPIEGDTKSATFKRDATGKWDVMLVSEFEMPDTDLALPNPDAVVGVDLGLYDFTVTSDGLREAHPRFFRKAERKLRRAQRVLSRCEKRSNRRLRAKRKVALIHRRIARQRYDFLHKQTTQLVRQYEGICIEDLNVRGLARTKLAKSIIDASFGEFRRQLEYKTIWNRRHLVVIDRFYPSSKTCHACGAVNATLALRNRVWICGCGARLDRDLNAALNIRSEGLKILAAGYAER